MPAVLRRLVEEENVEVIVSCTAEHAGRTELMQELGLEYHNFPTEDFEVPSRANLERG